jgi:hypothetical protein
VGAWFKENGPSLVGMIDYAGTDYAVHIDIVDGHSDQTVATRPGRSAAPGRPSRVMSVPTLIRNMVASGTGNAVLCLIDKAPWGLAMIHDLGLASRT